jgi:hypothetical protein
LLLLTTEAREALMNQIPMFERYQRLLLQNAYIANQARINSATETAEDKYLNLGKVPNCKTGTPTHACFLPWTYTETLSRVRKQQAKNKEFLM